MEGWDLVRRLEAGAAAVIEAMIGQRLQYRPRLAIPNSVGVLVLQHALFWHAVPQSLKVKDAVLEEDQLVVRLSHTVLLDHLSEVGPTKASAQVHCQHLEVPSRSRPC